MEVACVLVRDGRVLATMQWLINPGIPMKAAAFAIHGISDAMLANAPSAAVVMPLVRQFVGACPLVAHNAAFDSKCWFSELAHCGLPFAVPPPFVCTMAIARNLYQPGTSMKLGNLAKYLHLGLPSEGAGPDDRPHQALANALMTAKLFFRQQLDLSLIRNVADPDNLETLLGFMTHGAKNRPEKTNDPVGREMYDRLALLGSEGLYEP